MQVSFEIPGKIAGKGRPRFVRKTGIAYTPAQTQSAEGVVRDFAAKAMAGGGLLEGPVELHIIIEQIQPVSWSKKKKAASVFVTGKPDCDNQIKLISDAMNGIVWRDDSQVASIDFVRRYTPGPERAIVTVKTLLNGTPLFSKRGAV